MLTRFPEIGEPPVIIQFDGIFHEINHPFGGTPIYGKPHMHTQNLHSFDIQKKDINMNLINLHCSQVFDGFAKTSTKPLAPDLELGLGSVLLDLYGPGILARFFVRRPVSATVLVIKKSEIGDDMG